MAQNGAIYT